MKKYVHLTFILLLIALFSAIPARAAFLTFVQTLGTASFPAYGAGIALDPNEQNLYLGRTALSQSNISAIEVYRRDANTGLLIFLEAKNIAGTAFGAASPRTLVVSPDGKHVYVADWFEDRIMVFLRNSDGTLEIGKQLNANVRPGDDMAFQANGERLYVVSQFSELNVYARNADTGVLTRLQTFTDDVNGVDSLEAAGSVAISPGESNVYVAGDGIGVFRQIGGQLLEFVEAHTGNLIGLNGSRAVDISPDGKYVYVYSYTNGDGGAIGIFARDL